MTAKSCREVISDALGDQGVLSRANDVLEALQAAGYRVQFAPPDMAPVVASLRQQGSASIADAVEALAMDVDLMRRGWGAVQCDGARSPSPGPLDGSQRHGNGYGVAG